MRHKATAKQWSFQNGLSAVELATTTAPEGCECMGKATHRAVDHVRTDSGLSANQGSCADPFRLHLLTTPADLGRLQAMSSAK